MSITAPEVETTEEVVETPVAPQDPAPKTVPVERFNGLQRKLQEVIAENAALKASTTPSTPATPETPAPTTQPEESGLEAFLADLMAERLDSWRDKAIQEYPTVAPLREYLTANTRAETLALAKDLAEKLGGTPPSEEATETVTATTPTPTTPSPSVTGGSPALPPAPSDDEELAELRQRAARTHSDADYSAYLQKKHAMAGVEYPI